MSAFDVSAAVLLQFQSRAHPLLYRFILIAKDEAKLPLRAFIPELTLPAGRSIPIAIGSPSPNRCLPDLAQALPLRTDIDVGSLIIDKL